MINIRVCVPHCVVDHLFLFMNFLAFKRDTNYMFSEDKCQPCSLLNVPEECMQEDCNSNFTGAFVLWIFFSFLKELE